MIAIDSSALIAILRREPETDQFLRIIAAANSCVLSAVSFLEASMVLAGRTGDATVWAELDALIARAGIQVVGPDLGATEAACDAFLRYGKGRHPAALNLGTVRPMPSPGPGMCRCYSRAPTSRAPIWLLPPETGWFGREDRGTAGGPAQPGTKQKQTTLRRSARN